MKLWTEWAPFPDPRRQEFLNAPLGPGVYELRRRETGELVLRGQGRNCAYRMTSLLPAPLGQGTRNNQQKRDYVFENLQNIEYRSCACETQGDAKELEAQLNKYMPCLFPT